MPCQSKVQLRLANELVWLRRRRYGRTNDFAVSVLLVLLSATYRRKLRAGRQRTTLFPPPIAVRLVITKCIGVDEVRADT
jgi:hypothetical protein